MDDVILRALDRVSQDYYSTVYKNIEAFQEAFRGRSGKYEKGNFERFGERVFCYELYHQLRLEINEFKNDNSNLLRNAMLQAEVRKPMILDLLQMMNLHPYGNDIIPDFLLHSPGNSENHIFAIEVKCTDNFKQSAFEEDLKKLNHLITGFGYMYGYFISVNSEFEYIIELLNNLDLKTFTGRDRIKIIWKKSEFTKSKILNL
jgi:hypothetical protein